MNHAYNWSDPSHVLEGGESFLMMKQRVLESLRSYLRTYSENSILFVAHDGTVRALLSEIHNCDFQDSRCKIPQGDIVECSFDGRNFAEVQRL